MFIKNLKEGQQLTEEAFYILDVSKQTKKDGGPYVKFVLGDGYQNIDAVCWDYIESEYKQIKISQSIKVSGTVGTYKNGLQINISALSAHDNPEMLIPTLDEKAIEKLKEEYTKLKNSLNDEDTLFMDKVEAMVGDEFFKAPGAARNHHSYLGGLAEHTIAVALSSLSIAKVYSESANIDISLLILGSLVHDIGKLWENGYSSYPFVKTAEAQLLSRNSCGHIIIGLQFIGKVCADVKYSKRMLLEHIIASHHERIEWGAIVEPKTIEANIVARADYLDFFIKRFQVLKEDGANEIGFTNYDKALGRRLFIGKE